VQWQRPLAGELPPRVQSLGAAQFVGKNPLAGPVCQGTRQETAQVGLRTVWPRQESHGLRFPVSGRDRGSRIFLACVRNFLHAMPGGGGGPRRSSFFCSIFSQRPNERILSAIDKIIKTDDKSRGRNFR
jgi:hypothetical protein